MILWIPKQSPPTSFSVPTPKQKNGKTECFQWLWRIKSRTKTSTNLSKCTSSRFWTATLTLNGLNHWIQLWTTIKSWLWSQMTEYHYLQLWDSYLKYQTSKMPPLQQFLVLVCCSSTKLILDGCPTWIVGLIGLRKISLKTRKKWQAKSQTRQLLKTSERACSSDVSKPTSSKMPISVIREKLD